MKYANAVIDLVLKDDATPEQVASALHDALTTTSYSVEDELRYQGIIAQGNIRIIPKTLEPETYD